MKDSIGPLVRRNPLKNVHSDKESFIGRITIADKEGKIAICDF